MQALQSNIIFATGRVSIDKNSPYPISLPFSQISYCEPDEDHKLGSLFFQLIEDGYQLMEGYVAIEHMNVTRSDIGGTRIVEIQMLDSGKNVEVIFE